jgi:hypothetical protein
MSGEAEPKFVSGEIVAISATGVSNVRGNGGTAVTNAMKTASLKARGALVRYMSQDVSATQLLETASSVQQLSNNAGEETLTEDFERMAEVIRSQADDILKGATIVAECYDDERDLAFVQVGVSESIMAALGTFGAPDQTEAQEEDVAPKADASFERRSPNADLF